MRRIHVAGAIITHGGKVLSCQRSYGNYPGRWELPGGKLEPGETAEAACRREIMEELGTELDRVTPFSVVEFDYPDFHLTMDCFVCTLPAHTMPHMLEHSDMRWLTREQLRSVEWLPADVDLLGELDARWDEVVGQE